MEAEQGLLGSDVKRMKQRIDGHDIVSELAAATITTTENRANTLNHRVDGMQSVLAVHGRMFVTLSLGISEIAISLFPMRSSE